MKIASKPRKSLIVPSTHLLTLFSSSGLETTDRIDLFRLCRSFLIFFFFFLAGKIGEKSISLSIGHLFKSQTLNAKIFITFIVGSLIFLRLKRFERKVRWIIAICLFWDGFSFDNKYLKPKNFLAAPKMVFF